MIDESLGWFLSGGLLGWIIGFFFCLYLQDEKKKMKDYYDKAKN